MWHMCNLECPVPCAISRTIFGHWWPVHAIFDKHVFLVYSSEQGKINYLHGICPTTLGSRWQELLRIANFEHNMAWACLTANHSRCGLTNKGINKGVSQCRKIMTQIYIVIQSCTLLSSPMAAAWMERCMPRDSGLLSSNYKWHGFTKYFANRNLNGKHCYSQATLSLQRRTVNHRSPRFISRSWNALEKAISGR